MIIFNHEEGEMINKLFDEGIEMIREVAIDYETKLFLK